MADSNKAMLQEACFTLAVLRAEIIKAWVKDGPIDQDEETRRNKVLDLQRTTSERLTKEALNA